MGGRVALFFFTVNHLSVFFTRLEDSGHAKDLSLSLSLSLSPTTKRISMLPKVNFDRFIVFVHCLVFWKTICFALYAVVGRETQEEDPPLEKPFIFVFLRQSSAALILAGLARYKEGPFPKHQLKSVGFLLMVGGCVGISLSQNCFIFGERYTTATTAVTFEPLVPIFTGIAAFFTGNEGFGRTLWEITFKMGGSICAICGAIYTARGSERAAIHLTSERHRHVLGNIFCVGQVVCIATYLIILKRVDKRLLRKYPLWITCIIVSCGALLTLTLFATAVLIFPSEFWSKPHGTYMFTSSFLFEIAFAVLFATVQNYLIRTYAIKVLSPTTIGMYLTLNPPLTAALAYIFLKERITSAEMTGATLVGIGLILFSVGAMDKYRPIDMTKKIGDFSVNSKRRVTQKRRSSADPSKTPLLQEYDP